ncbi:MAG TPA: hypothetical protein VHO94_04090 [Oscillospiraceae bacterium]|nr:hypothetical protein [Oscillospiraceae bacterium]
MSYTNVEKCSEMPSFIASEVGLRQITQQIPQSMGVQDGIYKIVPAGTMFPANDATAVGVIFEPVDVTKGDHAGSVVVGGHLYGNRLPTAPADTAKTALQGKGLYFEDAVGMVR